MLSVCSSVSSGALQVFENIPIRNIFAWNRLIGVYTKYGHCEKVLACMENMQIEGVLPDAITFVLSLKACGNLGAIERGREIHAEVKRNGLLQRDLRVGNSVVHMYTKVGLIGIAQEVFDSLPERDIASWNTLMTGYITHGQGELALECFDQMQGEGLFPNAITFICGLKACCAIGGIVKGQEIHVQVERLGLLEREVCVGNALVHMYAKKGWMAMAQDIFRKLPASNVVSWNSLIGGYAKLGQGNEVLKCFEEMQVKGVSPDVITYVYSLKSCGEIGAREKGRNIHIEVERQGFLKNNCFVSNALVDMYAKCGFVSKAREVFDTLLVRDIISWNSLMSGYVEYGYGEETLKCYEEMQHEGIHPDSVTFICGLKACRSEEDPYKGIEIHAEIERKGLLEKDIVFNNTLVDMYFKCGLFAKGHEMFDKILVRDAVSWNILIAGCVQHGCGDKALERFRQMQVEGIHPDGATSVSILKACGIVADVNKGSEMHAKIEIDGLLETNPIVVSTLVDMYVKCGSLTRAQEVFDKLLIRDTVSWNALIAGYAEHGHTKEALRCFEEMQFEGLMPDAIAMTCVLKACACVGATFKGQEIYNNIANTSLCMNPFLQSTLIDLFGKGGSLAKAQHLFENLQEHDIVSWNALISGYVEHGYYKEALRCFERMKLHNVSSDAVTYLSGLKACCSIGSIEKGQNIHMEIVKKGFVETDVAIVNTLIDMYAKCGCLTIANQIFNRLPIKDVASWNALIAGYAQIGDSENIFSLFDEMIANHIKPDLITFVILLNTCTRVLLFQRSQTYFESMSKDYGISPSLEHHSCVIDLLCRSGEIHGAIEMIKRMPFSSNPEIWHTLLSGCKSSGNVCVGKSAFEHALLLSDSYVATSPDNIYAPVYGG